MPASRRFRWQPDSSFPASGEPGAVHYCENVIRHGRGADLLIHSVGAVRPELVGDPAVRRVMAHHASP
jgi:hypothetical protein